MADSKTASIGLAALEDRVAKQPRNPIAWRRLALGYKHARAWAASAMAQEQAIAVAAAARSGPEGGKDTQDDWAMLGNLRRRAGDHQGAIAAHRQAMTLAERRGRPYPAGHANLALVHEDLGSWDDALAARTRAVSIADDDGLCPPSQRAVFHADLARLHLLCRRFPAAVTSAKAALTLAPASPAPSLTLASALKASGRREDAEVAAAVLTTALQGLAPPGGVEPLPSPTDSAPDKTHGGPPDKAKHRSQDGRPHHHGPRDSRPVI